MKKTGILLFKIENQKKHFLLSKNNFKLIDESNDQFSDFNCKLDEYSLEESIKSFKVNTCNQLDINFEDCKSFTNEKYQYCIYYLECNIDDSDIEKVNKTRNFINSVSKSDEGINLLDCSDEDLKYFKVNEILDNKDKFEKTFFNTFLKLVKNTII